MAPLGIEEIIVQADAVMSVLITGALNKNKTIHGLDSMQTKNVLTINSLQLTSF